MLDPDVDWYRVGMAVAYLVIDVCVLGLWWFAWRRSGLRFFGLLVISGVLLLLFGMTHVIIACAEETLKTGVFGFHAYANFSHTLYVILPIIGVMNLLGYTLMVRWLLRSHSHISTATKV
jgi:predicted membrane protein